jgi:hypothetical protein
VEFLLDPPPRSIRQAPSEGIPVFDAQPRAPQISPPELRDETQEIREDLGLLPSGQHLYVGRRTDAPRLRPEEILALRNLASRTTDKINRTLVLVANDRWDDATTAAARTCFLLPPGPISLTNRNKIGAVLEGMRDSLRDPVMIKLLEPSEATAHSAHGMVTSRSPSRQRKGDVLAYDLWTGELRANSPPYIARSRLRNAEISLWTFIHETTHRSGTIDPQRSGENWRAGLVDHDIYKKTGNVQFVEKPKDLRKMIAYAEPWTAFILKASELRASKQTVQKP